MGERFTIILAAILLTVACGPTPERSNANDQTIEKAVADICLNSAQAERMSADADLTSADVDEQLGDKAGAAEARKSAADALGALRDLSADPVCAGQQPAIKALIARGDGHG